MLRRRDWRPAPARRESTEHDQGNGEEDLHGKLDGGYLMFTATRGRSKLGAMHCPVCSSEHLSDEVDYASFDNHARFKDWEPGILQWKDLTIGAERCRICLDCGYLLLFVGAEKLARLKAGRPEV